MIILVISNDAILVVLLSYTYIIRYLNSNDVAHIHLYIYLVSCSSLKESFYILCDKHGHVMLFDICCLKITDFNNDVSFVKMYF